MAIETATSAFGAMLAEERESTSICISGTAYIGGTSDVLWLPIFEVECANKNTNTGVFFENDIPNSTSSNIMEVRKLSGLKWEELAELFGVARRSLHFWASGSPLNSTNENQLRQVLAIIKKIDTGSVLENRSKIFTDVEYGKSLFDLLKSKNYQAIEKHIGSLLSKYERRTTRNARHLTAINTPRPTYELVDAHHEQVHTSKGKLLKSSLIKAKRSK